ncbi:MAG: DUF1640 domain-containing protein [Gammaproteobacteria bacterium]|nr:DUF1640 domain-containing protein [Gammaproteobacteria bacterium]
MKAANEAKPAGDATPVIFDTLKAAQELRKTGFEDRQAEAVVETISKAVSETVATKADLQLVRSDFKLLRSEMATKADLQLLRSEVCTLRSDVELLRSEMAAQENRIVIKLGGLMVTMIFVLLAIGPFYIRWVMSLLGSS